MATYAKLPLAGRLNRYPPWSTQFVPVTGSQACALKRGNKDRRFGNDAKLARTLAWYGLDGLAMTSG